MIADKHEPFFSFFLIDRTNHELDQYTMGMHQPDGGCRLNQNLLSCLRHQATAQHRLLLPQVPAHMA